MEHQSSFVPVEVAGVILVDAIPEAVNIVGPSFDILVDSQFPVFWVGAQPNKEFAVIIRVHLSHKLPVNFGN